jgi:hypothetical protein
VILKLQCCNMKLSKFLSYGPRKLQSIFLTSCYMYSIGQDFSIQSHHIRPLVFPHCGTPTNCKMYFICLFYCTCFLWWIL